MGTSKSLGSGTGGAWTDLKTKITGHFTGSRTPTFQSIVGGTVEAAGGIGVSGRGQGGGAGGGGGVAVGPVVGGLGGFGTTVGNEGLEAGLDSLGLGELAGKSAVEVVATVAEHLAESVGGLDGELMRNALREALLEAAALGDSDSYDDLEAGLQAFLEQDGVAGLVEVFLERFVFDAVWANIEAHVQSRAPDQGAAEAFMRAIEGICEAEVRGAIDDARAVGELDSLDWFGQDGRRIGRDIFKAVEDRLQAMRDE